MMIVAIYATTRRNRKRNRMTNEETKQRLKEGKLYLPGNEEIMKEQQQCLELQYEFNHSRPSESEKREHLLKQMFAFVGEGCYIEPPLHANWGGKNVHLGKGFYANFNLTLVDDVEIFFGDHVMVGPNVMIATGTHPILPSLREEIYQFNLPVHIGKNVWIGAGSIILPGITIGEHSVIGAGSIVTKDIPANVVAFGNPCKVVRSINQQDEEYYYKDRKIDI